MRITLQSEYPNFTAGQKPTLIEWTREDTPIHAYVNHYVSRLSHNDNKAIAILLEPRSIEPRTYDYMEQYHDRFRYVFTHNSEILKLNNARPLYFGGVWASDPDCEKTKDISMISSNKRMCQLHIDRYNIAEELENKIDVYGTYRGGAWATTKEAHAPYRFAVVIENYRDNIYFTEKICNCFANKTIPIYYGAKDIDRFFDGAGIIHVQNVYDIPGIVKHILDNGPKELYERLKPAVNRNYELVQDYICFEDQFYRNNKELLEGMYET